MRSIPKTQMTRALAWAQSVLGPIERLSDHTKLHGLRVSSTCRIRSPKGFAYLKVHESRVPWEIEIHGYEHWARAFGKHAPRLLGVRATPPLALLTSETPGRIVEKARLTHRQARVVWKAAGKALRPFHRQAVGPGFGQCRRDGTLIGKALRDPVDCVSRRLTGSLARAIRRTYLTHDEIATVRAAIELAPAFRGERPVPCHLDYCPANWLMNVDRIWTGVIDFEFSGWDLWVKDFTRDPDWHWINRPDLVESLLEGYGRPLSPTTRKQLLVGHTEYALNAILWGHENRFYGFEREGHESLAHLIKLLR